jgi:hypothetical protein
LLAQPANGNERREIDTKPRQYFPPARAALALAIECFDKARERLDEAQRALTGVEHLQAPVNSREAGELQTQMRRLYEITHWLNASAENTRPSLPAELSRAEDWLGEVATAAATAAERLSIAEQDYARAADAAREAMRQRERAVSAATVEAADPALRKLSRAVTAVYRREGRVRGLVLALREVGNRSSETAAFAAAEAIETALHAIRRQTAQAPDAAQGRSLIERLRSDPRASL